MSRPAPSAGIGAIVGGLATAPLVALFFAGNALFGLPSVPFDLFDALTRRLPGGLVTFGIDSIVKAIRALGLADTATAAKAAEQVMAIALLLAAGVVAGAALFAFLRARRRGSRIAGPLLGAAVAVIVLLLVRDLNRRAAVGRALADAWIVAAFVAWGAALGWAQRRLAESGTASAGGTGEAERLNRRQFVVRLGGAAATITVVGAGVGLLGNARRRREVVSAGRWSASHPLPNAAAQPAPARGTRPELTPLEDHYRIDINTTVPAVDEASWRLRVRGLVERPAEWTLAQLRAYEPLHQFVTLACISNPIAGSLIGTTRWTGVSLQRLLRDAPLKPAATHLKISAADGFHEVIDLERIRGDERVMLAYDWDGLPLASKHGFPLRIYIPDLYGMKQPKWIQSIDVLDHWEPGYWVERGWDRTARMKATSVIDTVAVDMMISQANAATRIPIGGIAHAGARGVSKVEVRVDGGAWNPAQLRAPLSGTTWVVWRYDWPFQPGNHTFTVRCFDGRGEAQIAEPAPPHPSGAGGLHEKRLML